MTVRVKLIRSFLDKLVQLAKNGTLSEQIPAAKFAERETIPSQLSRSIRKAAGNVNYHEQRLRKRFVTEFCRSRLEQAPWGNDKEEDEMKRRILPSDVGLFSLRDQHLQN